MAHALIVGKDAGEELEAHYDRDILENKLETYELDGEEDTLDELYEDIEDHEAAFAYGVDDDVIDTIESGGTIVITETDLRSEYTDKALDAVDNAQYRHQAELLGEKIDDKDDWLVLLHDNPDPDAIGSAIAFNRLVTGLGGEEDTPDIYHLGEINHQQNKAMVNQLEIGLERDIPALEDYDGVALLDTNPTSTNIIKTNGEGVSTNDEEHENQPYDIDEVDIDVIIDHHESWDGIEKYVSGDHDGYFDIRTERGSTASMMTDYLQFLNIEPGKDVATALLMGIMTDTHNLDPKRDFVQEDVEAVPYLYDRIGDKEELATIWESPTKPAFAEVEAEAILNREPQGTLCFSSVGKVKEPNAIASAADRLLDLEGVETAVVYGIEEDEDDEYIKISGRNTNVKIDIGKAFRNVFNENAGGSRESGGGKIPISEDEFGRVAASYKEAEDDQAREQLMRSMEQSIKILLSDLDKETS